MLKVATLSPQPTVQPYGAVAQSAHWLTFLLLIGSFTLGYWMTEIAMSPTRLKLYAYHKWIGVTIFALVALRLGWRLAVPPPPLPDSVPAWERRLAGLSHAALYSLLFAVPLSGWLMSSAKGFQTVYFEVLPVPDLIGKNKEMAAFFESAHALMTKVFLGLIALHVAAALKHHFREHDGVLLRMLPAVFSR